MTEDRQLGFRGLLMAGKSVHDDAQEPEVQAIFAEMKSTQEGRDALGCAAEAWAKYGLPPPWDPPSPPGTV